MNKIILLLLTVSTYTFAASSIEATDLVERTINFFIFIGLLWYFIADPIKAFFSGRSQGIADELQKVKDRLIESDNLKKNASSKVVEAEKFATNLVESSKKENKIINDNLIAQCEIDLSNLTSQQKILKDFEQRKMIRGVVENTVSNILLDTNSSFDQEAMANVILKKVA
ncbi:MAG: F0F1 ATP synthase subunit B [Sulfurimonas sp.]|nr:F0F1 ATP synthase subunit B [Sulfurimonas sp.]